MKITIFALLLCLTMLTGCAATVPQADGGLSNMGEESVPVFALVVKDVTNPYMRRMFEGFKMACEEIGAEAILGGPDTPSVDGQIKAIGALVEAGVSAIAIAANDADALEAALLLAKESGVIVMSLDSAVNVASRVLHIQPADPEVIGRVLIQAACRMIGDSGQIAVLSATRQATNQNLWIDWMKRELADYPEIYTGIELTEIVYGDDMLDASAECTRYLLKTYPELDVIIAPTVVGMLAAGTVLTERGSTVRLTGLGLPSEMERFIKNEICPWMYLWNPIEVGYLAAYTASALCREEITGAEGETFAAGNLGTKIITPAYDGGMEVVLANPVKFDIDNISDWKSLY